MGKREYGGRMYYEMVFPMKIHFEESTGGYMASYKGPIIVLFLACSKNIKEAYADRVEWNGGRR